MNKTINELKNKDCYKIYEKWTGIEGYILFHKYKKFTKLKKLIHRLDDELIGEIVYEWNSIMDKYNSLGLFLFHNNGREAVKRFCELLYSINFTYIISPNSYKNDIKYCCFTN